MNTTSLHHADSEIQALSAELKSHTAKAHEDAEQSSFMSDLLSGKLDQHAFIALQEQSWLFYSALETAVRSCLADNRGSELLDRRLERRQALENDLDLLEQNASWRDGVRATSATQEYVNRLNELGEAQDLPRILAHHYVRYLGDLSGGQVIARMMEKEYAVKEEALSFYRFDGLGKLKPYKDKYREALDGINLSAAERESLLDEASDAFTFNQRVFDSLG